MELPSYIQNGALILYALRYEVGTDDLVAFAARTVKPASVKLAIDCAKLFASQSDSEA